MGYIRHHAILVTSWNSEDIGKALAMVLEIFGDVPSVIESEINGYHSFFIPPDGSKEGWAESDDGDECRNKFINWIKDQAHKDGSNNIRFAEVLYGDDEGKAEVERHN